MAMRMTLMLMDACCCMASNPVYVWFTVNPHDLTQICSWKQVWQQEIR